ncbi:hypothetical protein HPP92_010139 [Vanilla planifolia]|uniref:Uncharacterized protein n=1 Tax=Vanilla planifolia TaxID=51239 RepID=A0A835QY08_VANPL|nr:hypothetical protein HPP92_010139 [Vanilla planifolia]
MATCTHGFVGDWWNGSGLYPDPYGWTPTQVVLWAYSLACCLFWVLMMSIFLVFSYTLSMSFLPRFLKLMVQLSAQVSEAIQIGTRAIKENRITVEEVNVQLQELDECVIDQKQVIEALERMPLQSDIEDEDIEEEFQKLEMELAEAMLQPPIHKSAPQEQATIDKAPGLCQRESTELSQTLSKLNIIEPHINIIGNVNWKHYNFFIKGVL